MFVAGWAGSCAASMAAWMGCSAASCFSHHVMKQSARVAYCFLFTLAMIAAWLMRDYGKGLLEHIPWIVSHYAGHNPESFFGVQSTYRVSMGNFLFFGTLAVVLLDTKYRADPRAKFLMSGSPFIKLGFWLLFNVFPFFLPNSVVLAYGYVARLGSVLFLIIQLFLLLDFVLSLNDRWVAAGEEDERYYKWMLAVTVGCYVGCIALIVMLFVFFKPAGAGSCSFNVAVISLSILLFVSFTLVSISPAARTPSLFPSAVVSVYTMYLAYGALQSEPHTEVCNGLGHEIDATSGSTLAMGMVIMLLSVVYSAFKAGSNTSTFTFNEDGDSASTAMLEQGELTSAGLDGAIAGAHSAPEGQSMARGGEADAKAMDEFTPVSYNYSFFHLVFALASAYIAMLMTGWGSSSAQRNLLDIGWTSVVMKLLTQWATGLLYSWTLVAHLVLPDREF